MLIINGKIITMADRNYEDGYIRIHKDKIAELGEMKDLSKEYELDKNEEIIDAKGAWVMPGLIDAQCQVGIVEEKIGLIDRTR